MKPLYTKTEYNQASSNDKLALQCYVCGKTYYKYKRYINSFLKYHNPQENSCKYCSKKCEKKGKFKPRTEFLCDYCNNKVIRADYELRSKRRKSNRVFCNRSCAAKYNNRHKKTGTRRSKLEKYIESQITIDFPNLKALYIEAPPPQGWRIPQVFI